MSTDCNESGLVTKANNRTHAFPKYSLIRLAINAVLQCQHPQKKIMLILTFSQQATCNCVVEDLNQLKTCNTKDVFLWDFLDILEASFRITEKSWRNVSSLLINNCMADDMKKHRLQRVKHNMAIILTLSNLYAFVF